MLFKHSFTVLFFLLVLILSHFSLATSMFSSASLEDWEEESFEGNTKYSIVTIDDRQAIKAETSRSASALFRKHKVDLNKTPYLNWSWRVDNIYDIQDALTKAGDDYPARIYVVLREGFFPWQTKALNYVWCSKKPNKPYWENPYTSKAVMIPVQCEQDKTGHWLSERINIKEDFKRIFNLDVNEIDGVAIMSDSDNAGGAAVAYYSDIFFSE